MEKSTHFDDIYQNTIELCNAVGVPIDLPRHLRRRSNADPAHVKKYIKDSLYQPYVEKLDNELSYRFGARQQAAFHLQNLIPKLAATFPDRKSFNEAIKPAYQQYHKFLPQPNTIDQELEQWRFRWANMPEKDRPADLAQLLKKFDGLLRTMHPNVYELIRILCTIPVTTASTERSFSTLGRILTDQRSSMLTPRLSDLAICSENSFKGHTIDYDAVIDIFMAMKKRRFDTT